MRFGDVLQGLEARPQDRWQRTGWNGKGMWISLQVPDGNSKMGLSYLYMRTAQGPLVPWLASQTDMLAKDWEIVQDASSAV